MSQRTHPFFAIFWWLTMLFFYLPLAIVVLFSFNKVNSAAHFAGFTLRWYQSLIHNQAIIDGFYNSMILALSSSFISLILGAFLGYGLYCYRGRRIGWLIALIYMPIVMPDIVFGIAEMTFFVRLNSWFGILSPGLLTMIIAHITFEMPFVALLIYARFVSLDASLFDAAKDLYSGPIRRTLYFIIPAIKPALIAGFFLAFTLSFDDFVISFFTSGPANATLPIYIWGAIRRGISPEINAIGALMIFAMIIAALISFIVNKRSSKRQTNQ